MAIVRRLAGLVLCGVVAVGLPLTPSRASPETPFEAPMASPFTDHVAEAALRSGLPPHWISAVIEVESGGKIDAVSPKGAMGLMQIMPATWDDLRARLGLGPDPFEPRDNIIAGAAYLRDLHDRFGAPGFLAAYNAGPGRYADHLATGRPLPAETVAYMAALAPLIGSGSVVDQTDEPQPDPLAWRRAPLFVMHPGDSASAGPLQNDGRSTSGPAAAFQSDANTAASMPDGLFVARSDSTGRP